MLVIHPHDFLRQLCLEGGAHRGERKVVEEGLGLDVTLFGGGGGEEGAEAHAGRWRGSRVLLLLFLIVVPFPEGHDEGFCDLV